jgi:hypothetical protein
VIAALAYAIVSPGCLFACISSGQPRLAQAVALTSSGEIKRQIEARKATNFGDADRT